jgi:hypothetical protein
MDEEREKLKQSVLEKAGYEPTNFGGRWRRLTPLEAVEIAIDLTGDYFEEKYQRESE